MSEGLKTQFQILGELKRVDEKIARIRADLEKIPAELAKLDATINQRREDYLSAKTQFDAKEKSLRSAEGDLKEKEEQLRKAESKMMEVKTNEEYQAALKENQGKKQEKSAIEDKALTLLTDIEEHRSRLKQREKEFKDFESSVIVDKKALEEEASKLNSLLSQQNEKRSGISATLQTDVLEIYNRVTLRTKGGAVVVVDAELCLGCHMRVRPQMYNEVLGYKAVHRCSNCGRILIPVPCDPVSESNGAL